jgi:hypothetical protein
VGKTVFPAQILGRFERAVPGQQAFGQIRARGAFAQNLKSGQGLDVLTQDIKAGSAEIFGKQRTAPSSVRNLVILLLPHLRYG